MAGKRWLIALHGSSQPPHNVWGKFFDSSRPCECHQVSVAEVSRTGAATSRRTSVSSIINIAWSRIRLLNKGVWQIDELKLDAVVNAKFGDAPGHHCTSSSSALCTSIVLIRSKSIRRRRITLTRSRRADHVTYVHHVRPPGGHTPIFVSAQRSRLLCPHRRVVR